MEEKKQELLKLTGKLKKELTKENPGNHIAILYDINDLVYEIGNEKIEKKFRGIYDDLIGERNVSINSILEHIEYFEKSIEKNLEVYEFEEEYTETKEEKIEEKPIPETIEEIKKEIDEILGDSIFVGIENFNFDLKGLDIPEEKLETIKKLQEDCKSYKLSNNEEKVEELRKEMYMLAYPRFFPLSFLNGKKIEKLTKEEHKRVSELLNAYDKKIKQEIEKNKVKEDGKKKESKKTSSEDKTTNDKKENSLLDKNKNADKIKKIREEMAVLIYGPNMEHKAYEGIENIDVHSPNSNLESDNEKDRFIELRQELTNLKENKKPRGKKVISVKSAKDFYKKHKKACLISVGIVLFAISLPHLLPTIMYLCSTFWGVAVSAGVPANAGLPVLLHDINTIIGAHIGASYAASSGIWTLASGAALNATAAEAGILITLGNLAKVALPFASAKMTIKNAINIAKEKIQKRKEKIEKENPERKGHFFKESKEYVKSKFNVFKEKTSEVYNNAKTGLTNVYTQNKEKVVEKYTSLKDEYEKKKEEIEKNKKFKNDNLSSGRNKLIRMLIEENMLTEEVIEELKTTETEEEAVEILKGAINPEREKGSK